MLLFIKLFYFLFLLSSCGFKPLYGNDLKNQYSYVCVDEASIATKDEILRSQFLSAFDNLFPNRSAICKYQIVGNIKEKLDPFLVQKDGTIERYNITLYLDFALSTPKWKSMDSIEISGSFLAEEYEFANFYAIRDTKKKLVENLAEELRYKILLIISQNETSS
jgi:hypothetical protein